MQTAYDSDILHMQQGFIAKCESIIIRKRRSLFEPTIKMKYGEAMELTHINENGEARMVDVHEKDDTYRVAKARGEIKLNNEAFELLKSGNAKKGDVLAAARIAGIMAAKKNYELIPLCHLIPLTKCQIDFEMDEGSNTVSSVCTACCVGKTGVEMEALQGVSVSLLTIYDMLKAIDREMVISNIMLMEKDGGKSGHFVRKL